MLLEADCYGLFIALDLFVLYPLLISFPALFIWFKTATNVNIKEVVIYKMIMYNIQPIFGQG